MAEEEEAPTDTTMHVSRAIAGSGQSLEWLVERVSPMLLAQARFRLHPGLRDELDPEDLVQRTWAVCLPKLFPIALGLGGTSPVEIIPRDGHRTSPLLAYLTSALLRIHNDLLRSKVRRPVAAPAGSSSSPLDRVGQSEQAVARAVRGEAAQALVDCMNKLTDAGREIIVLRGIEGLPYEHLAKKLGIQKEALRQRMRHATRQLRECVRRDYLDELAEA